MVESAYLIYIFHTTTNKYKIRTVLKFNGRKNEQIKGKITYTNKDVLPNIAQIGKKKVCSFKVHTHKSEKL